MSDIARDTRPQFGFLSVVGLFFLTILAVLIALYFYNADVRQAGDGAMSQAKAYKHTIATDYARFYECMRGVAPAESAQSARHEGEGVRASTGKPSAPIAVYPPYADYPTYPTYPGMGGGARAAVPAEGGPAATPEQQPPIGTYSQSPEYPQQAMTDPSAMAGGSASDLPGRGIPPGPMMQPGPSMQAGPMTQDAPPMQPGGGMQAGPMMQAEPSMQPGPAMGPAGAGSSMQPGAMAGQGPAMPPSMMGQRAMMPQGGGMQPGAGNPQGMPSYPQRPMWQAQGMTPPGMPPAGMVAPMPYGQGSSMAPMSRQAMAATPMYGAGAAPMQQQYAPAPYYGAAPGPQAAPSYGGYGPVPGTAYLQQSTPTVVPATPTLPMTSMMPPAGDTPPTLPATASQTDPQIVAARQAYANQQHQESIGIYRAYIARNGSDPSAFGELGNVLLGAGRPQEAAQAYYEAASRLIDVGQPGTVYLLLPHIEQHDPLLGAVLMRRLASLPRSIY